MIYLTSDLHLNHDKEFLYGARGFTCVEDMNNTLVENWNNTVSEDDIVYCLGDLCFGYIEKTNSIELIRKLKGHIILILGNHDSENKQKYYEKCSNIEQILYADRFNYNKITYFLCHYPVLTKNTGQQPVWALTGHTHSNDKFSDDAPFNYCVCVDAHNLRPVSIDEIDRDIREYTLKTL